MCRVTTLTHREAFPCVASLVVLVFAGCRSDSDSVCEDIGECAQGGSSSWIENCQSEANLLQGQANDGGCGNQFNAYYSCASSNDTCTGATPNFPGCDSQRAALDNCLTAITAGSYCTQLAAAETACASPGLDSGGGRDAGGNADAGTAGIGAFANDGPVPPACNLARDCLAQCYIANVGNVCAPAVDDLQAFSTCSTACPQ
jgi:hypothetical protein